MKIAIINQPLANRGDESAHKAFIRRLLADFPDAKIDVLFNDQKEENIKEIEVKADNVKYISIPLIGDFYRYQVFAFVFKFFPLSYLHPTLRLFRKQLKKYDYVICAPGGICMGGFMNWNHIWQLTVAMRLKKNILYWGRSIGPFNTNGIKQKTFSKASLKLLKYFDYISLRDASSVKIANTMGISVDEVVDSAFLDNPEFVIEKESEQLLDKEYVVFVPNELVWHYRYKNVEKSKIDAFYKLIIQQLINKYPEYNIVFLPQTYNSPIDDYSYFKKLVEDYSPDKMYVLPETLNSDVQQSIVAKSKLVIGARYHSIVFAINNNIPFISLSYEHKMKGLLETLNLENRMIEIQNIFDKENDELYKTAIKKCERLLDDINFTYTNAAAKSIVEKAFDNMKGVLK